MAGKQRFLSNKDNVIRTATLTASTIATATGTARPVPLAREGSGAVRLTGAYTGKVEATFDVEITDSGLGATPQASPPVFTGVGNGEMTGVSVDVTTVAQEFVVTLREPAVPERPAQANADGLRISALEDEGVDGNGTFISVDHSGLVFVDSGRVVPGLKPAGTIEVSGPAWDFGGLPLLADGKINPDTSRIRIGDDPQVYRQYSIQRGSFTVYRFLPALVREIRAGATVYRYGSGARTVTVTVGKPLNRFAAVTTPATAGDLRAIASNGGTKAVAISDGGAILYSANNGLTWSAAATNPMSGTAIYAVICIKGGGSGGVDRFLAGGDSIAYSDDFGANWTAAGASGFGTDDVRALAAGGGVALAVADSGQVSKSTDNGATWALQTAAALSNADFRCVVFALDRFIAGADNGVAGVTLDGGATWSALTIPVTSGGNVSALAFDPARRRLLLGAEHDGGAGSQDGILAYSDDLGATWTALAGHPHVGNPIRSIAPGYGVFAVLDGDGIISLGRELEFAAITNAPLDEGRAIAAGGSGAFLASDNDELARAVLAEVLTSVRSRYEFLYQLFSGSNLLAADQPAVFSETPLGLAYFEFQPMTASIAPFRSSSPATLAPLSSLALAAAAPTQTVIIACTDDTTPGSELWSVETSQGIGEATTGVPYNDGILGFTIPAGTYAEGQRYELQVLAGSPVVLSGGVDADTDNVWSVEGSLSGPLSDYTQAASPAAYNGEINFTIGHGTVPHVAGDKFTLSVEGGKFRWRKDGGSWSSEIDIGSSTALSDGLSAEFVRGLPPSFVDGDVHSFVVRQPYSVDNLRRPTPETFKWSSGTAVVVADCGSAKAIDTLALGRHTVPANAVITIEGSTNNFSTVAWTETLTWRAGLIAKTLSATRTQRYLRLTVNQPCTIGWWAALEASSVTPDADELVIKSTRSMRKGLKTSAFVGKGHAGQIVYNGWITQSDADELEAIVDWSKENGDEPIGFLPNVAHPEDAVLVELEGDDFEAVDLYVLQSDQRTDRNYSVPPILLAAVIE